jgi:hypothetical protein
VSYSVSANTDKSARTGTITIAGQMLTINQNGTKQYTLTVSSAGGGSGKIISTDSSINCGTACSAAYNAGTSVTLTAIPDSGSALSGWSGAGCSGTGSCSIAMNANAAVTATFAPCTLGISPTANSFIDSGGSGNVSVTASLGTCTWSAASNAPWIIVTSNATGSGNGTVGYAVSTNTSPTPRTGTITIAGQLFTITQTGITQYTLTVTKAGVGSGTVTSAPSGINCGSICSATFNSRASVVLTAMPDSGSTFTGWGGGCSGTGVCAVSMNANTAVNATYGIAPYIQDVRITFPQDGAVINSSYMMVRGTLTATSADIGIAVNGYPADIHDGNWVVNGLPLAEGVNTITVIAKDANNNTLTKTITVNKTQSDGVQLNANVASGASPLTVYFVARTNTRNLVTQCEMDFTGTGSFTSIGQNFDNVTYTYTAEGIYYPVLRVTDSGGNIFTNTIAITVVSKAKLNILLTQKWEGMKNQLQQGNTESAAGYITNESRTMFKYNFDLMKDYLPAIIQDMNSLSMKNSVGRRAQYEMITTQDGATRSFYIEFIVDIDGVWRINFF